MDIYKMYTKLTKFVSDTFISTLQMKKFIRST